MIARPDVDRALLAAGLLNLAASVAVIAGLLIDDRQILGINPWVKPWKFFVSVGIYLVTVAWMLPLAAMGRAARVVLRWTFIITMAGENVLISLQAYRGTTSHFNETSAFDGAVFSAMGLLIMLNTVAAVALLMYFFRAPAPMPRAVLAGIRLGLVLFLLASGVGGMMVTNKAHAIGVPDGGPGLPIVNWSTDGGDFRIAHFIGLHALQGLPLLGWLFSRTSQDAGVAAVYVAAIVWAIVLARLLSSALAGHPML